MDSILRLEEFMYTMMSSILNASILTSSHRVSNRLNARVNSLIYLCTLTTLMYPLFGALWLDFSIKVPGMILRICWTSEVGPLWLLQCSMD